MKLLRKEIEEDFVINKENNFLKNTDTVFLLQSLKTGDISKQLEGNTCYLNRSSAFLTFKFQARKKKALRLHLKLTIPGFSEAFGKYFEFRVVYLVVSSWDKLVVSDSLLPPGGDSD